MCKANLNIWLLVWVLVVILAGQAADGATITVANDGGPADFTSIQAAIDDANDYDQIEVAPGTYNEAINFNGKAIRLYSTDGPNNTIIDGTGNYHVVQCVNSEDANTILEGFTITGGNANGPPPGEDSVGGGMFNDQSSPTVTNCFFTGNAAFEGAGMYNYYYSSPAVTGCTFSDNSAGTSGGGMYNFLYSSPTVTGCLFSANTATVNGGGIYNRYYSHTTVNNCTFGSNTADKGGGMYNLEYSSPTVTNCLFNSNIAVQYGGGMFNSHSIPTLTNCTFSGNSGTSGGGMYNDDYSNPTLINCILWEDTPNEIFNVLPSAPLVTYCDIQGGYVGITNIDSDPCFIDTDNPDPNLWNFRLMPVSPCIDAGSNTAPNLPLTDLAGNPRVADGDNDGLDIVDMGVFELQPGIHNTTQNKWYVTIQVAIDDANNGDQIAAMPGTYYEAVNFLGKAVRLYSSGGASVTEINGTGYYHVVQCVSGEGPDTILEGFTITGGNAYGSFPDSYGGGMFNDQSSPTVTNCTFSMNTATEFGGGMANYSSSSPAVTNCTFTGNTAYVGGGMANYSSSSPAVTNCTFTGNSGTFAFGGGMFNGSSSSPAVTNCTFTGNSGYDGGGMNNNGSSPSVTDCTFSGNTAAIGGGMLNTNSSSPTVTNCTFSGNSAEGGMCNKYSSSPTVTGCTFTGNSGTYIGGMYNNSSSPAVTNCTFTGNSGTYIGGMYNDEYSSPTVTNCILWGDTNEIFDDEDSSTTATYSDVGGGWPGTGNIDADPNFVDAASGNLRLSYGSPCIDAADSAALLPMPYSAIDLDGNIRFVDVSSITNTGSGPLVFLDMGAYEYPCNWSEGNINCDGVVDFKDLAILAGNWLAGTEPEL